MIRKRLALLAGPALGALSGLVLSWVGLPADASWVGAVTVCCAAWWILEPVHIAATSLLPFVVFPLAGVMPNKDVAQAYGHHLVLLLLGGFILSRALEKSGAHRRLALGMIRLVGGRGGGRVVLGFALAAFVLSMWISNTATTLMLLPVALAVLDQASFEERGRLTVPLLLGVAYGSSLGGMTTPIGTPGNALFMAAYQEARGQAMSFGGWMTIALPLAMVLLGITWLWITRGLPAGAALALPDAGTWRREEKRVLAVFVLTALAWITRTGPVGGWSGFLGMPDAGDETVALTAVLAAFLIPDGKGGRLLDWSSAVRIPWDLLILVGGGVAIAKGFETSGLSAAFGRNLAGLSTLPTVAMIAIICLGVTFLTEVTSNTATTALLMPLLAAAAGSAGEEPSRFMIPAALSASCAFMLPVATPPNAVVYGSGLMPGRAMAREGFVLNLIGAVVITAGCLLLLR